MQEIRFHGRGGQGDGGRLDPAGQGLFQRRLLCPEFSCFADSLCHCRGDGLDDTLNFRGQRPVQEYLGPQGRFSHLTRADMARIQQIVDAEWRLLLKKAGENRNH